MGPWGPGREGWSVAGDAEMMWHSRTLLLAPCISPSPTSSLALGVCLAAGVPRALSLPSPCKAGCCRASLSPPAAATCGLVMAMAGEGRRGSRRPRNR